MPQLISDARQLKSNMGEVDDCINPHDCMS
jgi:hypothetical protein